MSEQSTDQEFTFTAEERDQLDACLQHLVNTHYAKHPPEETPVTLQHHRRLHDGITVTTQALADGSVQWFDTLGRTQVLSFSDARGLAEDLLAACEEAQNL